MQPAQYQPGGHNVMVLIIQYIFSFWISGTVIQLKKRAAAFVFKCMLSTHQAWICHWAVSSLFLLRYFRRNSSRFKAGGRSWCTLAETLWDGFIYFLHPSILWRIQKQLNQVLLLRALICTVSMCGGAFLPPTLPDLSSCYREYLRRGNTIGVINFKHCHFFCSFFFCFFFV